MNKRFSYQWNEQKHSNEFPMDEFFAYVASLEVAKKERHPSGARFALLSNCFGDDKPKVEHFKTIKKFRQALESFSVGVEFEAFRNFDKGVTVKVVRESY